MAVKIRNPHTHSSTYPDSYYVASANNLHDYPQLTEHLRADVCIVGGGFSGINTALELADRGYQVIVLEAFKVGWGASGRNGGQMIRGITHDAERFKDQIGSDGVKEVSRMGLEAVDIVRERIAKFDIQCDLKLGFADLAHKPRDIADLEADKAWLDSIGYQHETRLISKADIANVVGSDSYSGALIDMGSGHLHPLNLVTAEARAASAAGVQIFEYSAVESMEYGEPCVIRTAKGQVTADKLILCANAYVEGLDSTLEKTVLPCGSYIIATEQLPEDLWQKILPMDLAVCDMRIALNYYRLSADKRLLFGGRCNYNGRDPKDIEASMRPKMEAVFPFLKNTKVDFKWGGMIGIGANRMPQIGRLRPNVYYTQAYCGHGVNTTHLAARVLAEAIHAESHRIDVFEKIKHFKFPGGPLLRSPLLAIGMSWYQLKDMF